MSAARLSRMRLVGYLMAGPSWHNNGAWRHPDSDAIRPLDPARYEHLARVMEQGCFDALFFVDFAGVYDAHGQKIDATTRWAGQMAMLDPMQLLATIARVTQHIGLAATMSTTGTYPFHVARSFATLDHISGGRAAWNVVTTASRMEARNLGLDPLPDKNTRYDIADEVLEACDALWGSWEADALRLDQQAGIFADPEKIHYVDYEGRWVRTRGPLSTPRSPQNRPVIMQAGSSPRGRAFAARWAEVIFTHQRERSAMQAFMRDIKGRMTALGRAPEHCAILPAIDVVVGETQAQAEDLAATLADLVNPELGVAEISTILGRDLSGEDLDAPLAEGDAHSGYQGIIDNIRTAGTDGVLTLREAGRQYGISQMTPRLIGTATRIADHMQDMFESACCDGFMVVPALSPGGYEDFVRHVVPELQRRGLFRTRYTGRTLRENLFGPA